MSERKPVTIEDMDRPLPRSSRSRRYLAAAVGVGIAAIVVLAAALARGSFGLDAMLPPFGMTAFTIVGALILDRRPGQPIGRICLVVGLALASSGAVELVVLILDDMPGPLPPFGAVLAVIAGTLSSVAIFSSGPLLTSRFPDGPSSGWLRRIGDALLVFVVVMFALQVVQPGEIQGSLLEPVDNPIGIAGLPTTDQTSTLTLFAYGAAFLFAAIGLTGRYRRGSTLVRAQIRWFAASVTVTLVIFGGLIASQDAPDIANLFWWAWIASLLLPPVAIAIAILRYRLYDIDRIISRTVTYALVTVVLFAAFAVINLAFQSSMNPFTEAGPVVVAGSTLLLAVVFNPVRAGIQRVVDRRFNRAQYDAEQLVEGLATRLRADVDLAGLRTDILDVVDRSVQPDGAFVWLRPRGGS